MSITSRRDATKRGRVPIELKFRQTRAHERNVPGPHAAIGAGGTYILQGTLGQPDAAVSSGGTYTLNGGFWSAIAIVQTEGAPVLRIILAGTNVILAWPNPSTGFQLQETSSLSPPSWADVNTPPTVVGGEKQVTQPVAPAWRFYRLRK